MPKIKLSEVDAKADAKLTGSGPNPLIKLEMEPCEIAAFYDTNKARGAAMVTPFKSVINQAELPHLMGTAVDHERWLTETMHLVEGLRYRPGSPESPMFDPARGFCLRSGASAHTVVTSVPLHVVGDYQIEVLTDCPDLVVTLAQGSTKAPAGTRHLESVFYTRVATERFNKGRVNYDWYPYDHVNRTTLASQTFPVAGPPDGIPRYHKSRITKKGDGILIENSLVYTSEQEAIQATYPINQTVSFQLNNPLLTDSTKKGSRPGIVISQADRYIKLLKAAPMHHCLVDFTAGLAWVYNLKTHQWQSGQIASMLNKGTFYFDEENHELYHCNSEGNLVR